MSVADLQRLFDELEVQVAAGSGGTELLALLETVIDQENNVMRTELHVLKRTQDGITAYGEEVQLTSLVVTDSASAQQIVAAPGTGNHLVLKGYSYQLLEDVDTVASLRQDGSNVDIAPWNLSFSGLKAVGQNLNPDGIKLTTNTALEGKISVSVSSGVRITVCTAIRPDVEAG